MVEYSRRPSTRLGQGNTLLFKTKSGARLAQRPPQPSVTCDDPCLGAYFTTTSRSAKTFGGSVKLPRWTPKVP